MGVFRMSQNLTRKLLAAHHDGELPAPGEALPLSFDQTLTQDATGTLVMLELEAMGLERVQTEVSVQYVDHNLIQAGFQESRRPPVPAIAPAGASALWFSRPGNGVSHPVHMQRFGKPGAPCSARTATRRRPGRSACWPSAPAALDVALAMAGEPFYVQMPRSLGRRADRHSCRTGSAPRT